MSLVTSILLVVWVPSFDVIGISHRWSRHELILFNRVDINTHVLAHESNAEGMGESANLEWFARHGTGHQRYDKRRVQRF
jgi:hypothetical protein